MMFQTYDDKVVFLGDYDNVKGEVDFDETDDGVIEITKTYVDPSERGMGLANRLMGRAASHIRFAGKKARPVCAYAKKWFDEHPEQSDLLAER